MINLTLNFEFLQKQLIKQLTLGVYSACVTKSVSCTADFILTVVEGFCMKL